MTYPNLTNQDTISLNELLVRSAQASLDFQSRDGSFPPGQNGIYNETETPVRTTSSWLLILTEAYKITGNQIFENAANNAADYLMSDEARPHGHTFHSREVKNKDKCDGLVGQGSPIKALTYAGQTFDRKDLIKAAMFVFKLHPFDDRLGLWERVEITGERLSFDRTLNHQLYFAAKSAALLDESNIVNKRIRRFLDQLGKIMRTRSDGSAEHHIRPPILDVTKTVVSAPRHWPLIWNELVAHYHARTSTRRKKELGYHPNVLVGLSMLRQQLPDHEIWNHDTIRSALLFSQTDEYKNQIYNRTSKYGSMIPMISHARVLSAFDIDSDESIQSLLSDEIKRSYNPETGLLEKDTVDPNTHATSIKSVIDLPNIEVTIPR